MNRPRRALELRTFEELLSANLDALYRTALRLCAGRAPDAEDLLQDAMLRAVARHGALRDAGAARAWLFTILVRTHLNRARASGRRAEMVETDLDDAAFEDALAAWSPGAMPDELCDRKWLRDRVAAALDALEADLRAVILLADVQGFSQREAAEILDIPQGTVASRLFRGRRALRDSLRSTMRDGERDDRVVAREGRSS